MIYPVCLGSISGFVISSFFDQIPFWYLILLILIISLVFRVFINNEVVFWVGIFFLCLLFSLARVFLFDPRVNSRWVGCLYDESNLYEAVIIREPYLGSKNLQVETSLSLVDSNNEKIPLVGKVLLFFPPSEFHYDSGDVLIISGSVEKPAEFDDFSYREYLETRGIFGVLFSPQIIESHQIKNFSNFVKNLRFFWRRKLALFLPEPHLSLLEGIILGGEIKFPFDFEENLQRIGLVHVVVASGSNILILISFIEKLFFWSSKKFRLFILLFFIIFYYFLSGGNPPILRASVMATISLVAVVFGRQKQSLILFLEAVFVILWVQPFLISSLSFQLSLGATLSLILFYPFTKGIFKSMPSFWREIIFSSFIVYFLITPWLSLRLGGFSLIAPFANLIILPIIEPLMLVGIILSFFVLSGPLFLSRFCSWLLWLPLEYFVRMSDFLGSLPFVYIEGLFFSWQIVLVFYFSCLIFLLFQNRSFSVKRTNEFK